MGVEEILREIEIEKRVFNYFPCSCGEGKDKSYYRLIRLFSLYWEYNSYPSGNGNG